MAEVKKDNPAGRLHHILVEAEKRPRDKKIRDVWSEALEIDPSSVSDLFDRFVTLQQLVAEVKERLQEEEKQTGQDFLKNFAGIETVAHITNFEEAWERCKNILHPDGGTMTRLELGAQALSKRRTENEIGEEELAQLKGEIESLTEKVITSESLSAQLKAFIVEKLETIRRAIQVYRLRGITDLRKAFEESLGGIFVNKPDFERAKETEEVGWFKRVLFKTWALITFARVKEGVQLASEIKELLGPISGG